MLYIYIIKFIGICHASCIVWFKYIYFLWNSELDVFIGILYGIYVNQFYWYIYILYVFWYWLRIFCISHALFSGSSYAIWSFVHRAVLFYWNLNCDSFRQLREHYICCTAFVCYHLIAYLMVRHCTCCIICPSFDPLKGKYFPLYH